MSACSHANSVAKKHNQPSIAFLESKESAIYLCCAKQLSLTCLTAGRIIFKHMGLAANFRITRKTLLIVVGSFSVIGVALLALSYAQTPNPITTENLLEQTIDNGYKPVDGVAISATTKEYLQRKSPAVSLRYKSGWQLYRYDYSSDKESGLLLRIIAPKAKISTTTHSGEDQLTEGCLIEVAATTPTTFATIDAYMDQIGYTAKNTKTIKINGLRAFQYLYMSPEGETSNDKTISVYKEGDTLYSISYIAGDSSRITCKQDYQQVLDGINTKLKE